MLQYSRISRRLCSRGPKQETNGRSSRDSHAAFAPSSVPSRTVAEENSTVQLSGESEERYKLRMQRLDRINSKLQDKDEEIKKQREKEVCILVRAQYIHCPVLNWRAEFPLCAESRGHRDGEAPRNEGRGNRAMGAGEQGHSQHAGNIGIGDVGGLRIQI